MNQLQSDTMTATPTRWQRRTMPAGDRRERVVNYVMVFVTIILNSFVMATAGWAGWPIWAQTLMCLPATCACLAVYALWYRRRTPTTASIESA